MLNRSSRRRRSLRRQALPTEWWTLLMERVPLVQRLPREDLEELGGHLQVLLGEKRFEGAGDLQITDEIRLITLAQAAVLLLHRETSYFPRLVSLIVYPGAYVVRETIETEEMLVEEVEDARVGESWSLGTLILSWEEVEADLEDDQQNVVLHEFAHHLDAESGEMNGAPLLPDRELRRQWAAVMSAAHHRLGENTQQNRPTALDPYGAEEPSEFFAVAVEAFFLRPHRLAEEEPDLYRLLAAYFRQDPITWI
mgnify:CR=1 FL=1